MKTIKFFLGLPILLLCNIIQGQELESNLQLRPRFEYREGYKNMLNNGQSPTSFVSQRSRLNLQFTDQKIKAKVSAQNIRVWGDMATTANSDKNGVMFFEAWAQYQLNENWAVKAGRQVISFDNQRIMGEIDWAQQGQSHDAAVIKFAKNGKSLDVGASLSSNAENTAKMPYEINNYKSMQFARYKTDFGKFGVSLLFLNAGYEFTAEDKSRKTDYNQTFGSYIHYKQDKFSANIGGYGQTGKRNDSQVKAYYAGLFAGYKFTENWELKGGLELLSGKDQNDTSTDIKSFNPIFGTNHAFNGLMDYFYVGNHQNSVGLQDVTLGISYTHKKLSMELAPHVFWSHGTIYKDTEKLDAYLGTEIDFTAKYNLDKYITLQSGYSVFADSESLRALKGIDSNPNNHWAWLMVTANLDLYKSR